MILSVEIWKDLENYPGYSVSSAGRVRSNPRRIWNGHGYFVSKEKLLKPNPLAKGYLQVDLKVDKKRHPRQIHRLVAEAFIPNPNDYPQINHINGRKYDNRVENLEWCDNSMNQIHAYKTGLKRVSEKSGHPRRPVKLINTKTGESISFKSIMAAAKFLGKNTLMQLRRVLNKQKHYHTIKGYIATFAE